MKKNLYGIFILALLCLTIGCGKQDILKKIELNDNKCEIKSELDTHGGFLGDGDYFAKIKCSKINYNKLSKNWKKLPLSDSLNQVTQIKKCNDKDCKNIYERFSIPSIENGYYYFLNKQAKSKNKYDDTNLNDKTSLNFILAIMDMDTNIIYYYELDT